MIGTDLGWKMNEMRDNISDFVDAQKNRAKYPPDLLEALMELSHEIDETADRLLNTTT